MTCDNVEPELVAYHFGLLEGDARDAVEGHLVGCAACLRAFVTIKRAIETGASEPSAGEPGDSDLATATAPSAAARSRLRRAVARELNVPASDDADASASAGPRASRRWWERPVAFAVAASFVLLANQATRALMSRPGAPPYALSEQPSGRAPP
jgi:hypothetical protein